MSLRGCGKKDNNDVNVESKLSSSASILAAPKSFMPKTVIKPMNVVVHSGINTNRNLLKGTVKPMVTLPRDPPSLLW